MLLSRTVAPVADLVTAADLKAHLRVDHTYDDTTIDALKDLVIAFFDGRDGYLQRALVTQTWAWKLHCFPVSGELHFPLPPLQSVSSIQYYDTTETLQTYDAANYHVYADVNQGYLKLKQSAVWPAVFERDDAVTVTFIAGYGLAAAVPRPIWHAALLLAGQMYANRGDEAFADAPASMNPAIRALLASYRVQQFGAAHERHWIKARAG